MNRLYQLPNGNHIDPEKVDRITVLPAREATPHQPALPPRLRIDLCDGDFIEIVDCTTEDEARRYRDNLAARCNRVARGTHAEAP